MNTSFLLYKNPIPLQFLHLQLSHIVLSLIVPTIVSASSCTTLAPLQALHFPVLYSSFLPVPPQQLQISTTLIVIILISPVLACCLVILQVVTIFLLLLFFVFIKNVVNISFNSLDSLLSIF